MAQSSTISGSFREVLGRCVLWLVLRVFQNLVETIEPVHVTCLEALSHIHILPEGSLCLGILIAEPTAVATA